MLSENLKDPKIIAFDLFMISDVVIISRHIMYSGEINVRVTQMMENTERLTG